MSSVSSDSASETTAPASVSRGEAFRYWLKLGFISFGGPAGQISMMHQELVERRRWISEQRFLHALNYTMVLPGPEAQQLATYIGWLLHGVLGRHRCRGFVRITVVVDSDCAGLDLSGFW